MLEICYILIERPETQKETGQIGPLLRQLGPPYGQQNVLKLFLLALKR
jgi:hypothetical protein